MRFFLKIFLPILFFTILLAACYPTIPTDPNPTTTTTTESSTTTTTITTTTTTPLPPEPKWSALAGTTLGTASYPVPTDAIIVSPTGNDMGAGTVSDPLQTLSRAISVASSGKTIVLRAGTYHESVTIQSKILTIQSWPNEVVWLDGTTIINDWIPSNGKWVYDGWTLEFDTYYNPAWPYVDPAYPMANYPEQIFIDGYAQKQVGSLAEVSPGTFYLDRTTDQLWIGSDPSGKKVRVSDLQRAITVRFAGSSIRGIGIRRYAPSISSLGAVRIETNATLENVVITDTATTGLFVGSGSIIADGATIKNVTISRSGMLGFAGYNTKNLMVDKIVAEKNNLERFNTATTPGGLKITNSENTTVRDSIFIDNRATGLWLDVDMLNMIVTGNESRNNDKHGIFLEISSTALVANNFVTGNGSDGIKVNNVANVELWNNTFVDNGTNIEVVKDSRTQPLGPVGIFNNIIANGRICMICGNSPEVITEAGNIISTGDWITNNGVIVGPLPEGNPIPIPSSILALIGVDDEGVKIGAWERF